MVTTAMSPMEYNFHMGDMYLKENGCYRRLRDVMTWIYPTTNWQTMEILGRECDNSSLVSD